MYLCNSKGSACALPFFSLQSSQQPPNPQKGAFRARMALQKGHTWNVIRPKRAAKCGPCALSFGPNENKTVLLQMIRNGFSRI